MADSDSDWEDGAAAEGNSQSEDEYDEEEDADEEEEDEVKLSTKSNTSTTRTKDATTLAPDSAVATKTTTTTKKKSKETTTNKKIRVRPIKHKTPAAALHNPSNFLKRSHQVLILDDEDDEDDVTVAQSNNAKNVKEEETDNSSTAGMENGGEGKKKRKAAASASGNKNRKKLRRVDFETEDDGLDHVPSFERLTNKGGYAHTKNARMKISQANKGNTPWNKGKSRSEDSKSKISAGVKARNRTILLENLAKWNMSEDDYLAKKVQIKHLREKVRKSRLVVKQHEVDMEAAQKRQEEETMREALVRALQKEEGDDEEGEEEEEEVQVQDSLESLPRPNDEVTVPPMEGEEIQQPKDASTSPETDEHPSVVMLSTKQLPPGVGGQAAPAASTSTEVVTVGRFKDMAKAQASTFDHLVSVPLAPTVVKTLPTTNSHSNALHDDDEKSPKELAAAQAKGKTLSLSTREITWQPFDLGHVPDAAAAAAAASSLNYQDQCPLGGPGGLICCNSCSNRYSRYLSQTFSDLERHQITHLADEVEEIMDYARETKKQLAQSTKAALSRNT